MLNTRNFTYSLPQTSTKMFTITKRWFRLCWQVNNSFFQKITLPRGTWLCRAHYRYSTKILFTVCDATFMSRDSISDLLRLNPSRRIFHKNNPQMNPDNWSTDRSHAASPTAFVRVREHWILISCTMDCNRSDLLALAQVEHNKRDLAPGMPVGLDIYHNKTLWH